MPSPQLQKLTDIVCKEYQVKQEEITNRKWESSRWGTSQRAPENVAIAKQVICYLGVNHLVRNGIETKSSISAYLQYSDRTQVGRYRRKIGGMLTVVKELKEIVERIEKAYFYCE